MAISFNDSNGSAKAAANRYKYVDGDNVFRLVGGVLPRYVYWVDGPGNKRAPFECLGFNRDTETFDNLEKDWVREFYPDLKCGWSYSMQAIVDGKIVLVDLKKKLWEQIRTAAEDLGDPTDPENGWAIRFKRVKTGPLAYNVEYQLQVLKCKNAALTDAEKVLVSEMKPIDSIVKRPTANEQYEALKKMQESAEPNQDPDIEKDFDI